MFSRFRSFCFLVTVLLLVCSPTIGGWGRDGHEIICKIANQFPPERAMAIPGRTLCCRNFIGIPAWMTPQATLAMEQFLPKGSRDLSKWCSWADERKDTPGYRWSVPLHFINTPDRLCNYDYERDCKAGPGPLGKHRLCVAGAIRNYTSQLRGESEGQNLTEALLFLSHFIGDIHQPLHVGYTSDRGGSTTQVQWFGFSRNLHQVWDSSIIKKAEEDKFGHDLTRLVTKLLNDMQAKWKTDVSDWTICDSGKIPCPDEYATESIHEACAVAYDIPKDRILGKAYFKKGWEVVEERLAQGGVRLAATLNDIFHPRDFALPVAEG